MNDAVTRDQLRHVVEAAGLAPSVHNTQPWRFVLRAGALELHADPSRRLRVLDPEGRQLHLSCGAALLHARVAARALGLDVQARLLPDPVDPDHLADLDLAPGAPATCDEVRLATAILNRRTHRGAFAPEPVSGRLMTLLRGDALGYGAHLRSVVRDDDLLKLEVLLSRADALEQDDDRYRDEVGRWVQRAAPRVDGIPLTALPELPGSSLRLRDFTLARPEQVDGTAPRPDRPAVVVLSTDDDEPRDWLQAGQALAAVLLRAADAGVQAQPLGQVTDVIGYRLGLRHALGLTSVPQLVLRMGYATGAIATPRRSVEDILTYVGD